MCLFQPKVGQIKPPKTGQFTAEITSDFVLVEPSSNAFVRCEDDINCRPGWTNLRDPVAP